MAITRLSSGQVILTNASHLYMTPYVGADTVGGTTYDVVSIVGDTISIEQDDPDTNEIAWEFGDTPLMQSITLGNVNFAATCIDMQSTILEKLFGWTKNANGVFAPTAYTDLYCAILITFHDANLPMVIMPKVKISSKAVIQSLKTGTAEAQLSGTAYAAHVSGSADGVSTPIHTVTQFGTTAPSALLPLGSVFVDTTGKKIYTVIDNDGTIEWDNGVAPAASSAYYTNGAVTHSWDGSEFSSVSGVPATVGIETTWGLFNPTSTAYVDGGSGSYVQVP